MRDALLQRPTSMNLAAVVYPDPRRVTPEGHWEPSAYDASLAVIQAAGYQAFELARTRRLTTPVAAALRDHATGQGLTAVALHAPSLHGRHVLRRQVAIAAAARTLGAPLIVFHVSSIRFASPDPTVRHRTWEGDRRFVRRL